MSCDNLTCSFSFNFWEESLILTVGIKSTLTHTLIRCYACKVDLCNILFCSRRNMTNCQPWSFQPRPFSKYLISFFKIFKNWKKSIRLTNIITSTDKELGIYLSSVLYLDGNIPMCMSSGYIHTYFKASPEMGFTSAYQKPPYF